MGQLTIWNSKLISFYIHGIIKYLPTTRERKRERKEGREGEREGRRQRRRKEGLLRNLLFNFQNKLNSFMQQKNHSIVLLIKVSTPMVW